MCNENRKREEELSKILSAEERDILGSVNDNQITYWEIEQLSGLKKNGRSQILDLGQDFLEMMIKEGLEVERYHFGLLNLIMEIAKTAPEAEDQAA